MIIITLLTKEPSSIIYNVIPAEVLCVFPVVSSVIWVNPFFSVCFEAWSTPVDGFNSPLVVAVVPAVVGARRM